MSVWGTSSRDVYVVGADARDGTGPQAFHFNGQRFDRVNTNLRGGDLWWVHGTAADSVFMVGSGGTVLRYNPTTGATARMTTPSAAPTLFGVWGLASNDVWAVGGDTRASTAALWHFNGTTWTDTPVPVGLGSQVVLYKVWGRARNDVWTVGSNGTTLHYDGSAWSRVTVPTTAVGPLFTVHGAGAQRYAVGGNASGILLEGVGATDWRAVDMLDAPRLAGVFVTASGNPYAVGNTGALYSRKSGAWREVSRPPQTDLDFHAVWAEPDTGAVWAVGGQVLSTPLVDGVVMRFGERLPATIPVVTPPELTRCPAERGTICTWAGNGVQGFNGDGRPLRESAMYWPMDVEFSPTGAAYVIDWNNHKVRRATAMGTFETVMGSDFIGDGPPGETDLMEPGAMGDTVSLNHPTDMLFLGDGRLLVVAWHNHKLRRYDPMTNRVFVTSGRGGGFAGDGMPAASPMARFFQPRSAVFDRAGNMYVLDQGNSRIRKIDAMGMLSTFAGGRCAAMPAPEGCTTPPVLRGFAGDGGPASMASFNWATGENPEPEGSLALGPDGNLYISDTNNHRIRRINLTTNVIDTVAGDGMNRFAGDDGPPLMASFSTPQDIEFGPDGLLYVADTGNHRVRVIDLTANTVRTVAGNGQRTFSGDRGPAREASLWRPWGVAFDRDGSNLYIADTLNNRVRRVQLR